MAFVHLSGLPSPAAEHVCSISSLAGGLNIHDAPWNLREDQSPEMKNMWWKDGLLCSRPAQTAFAALTGAEGDCACTSQPYKGWYFFHCGTQLWAVSEDLQTVYEISTSLLTYVDSEGETLRGLPDVCGTFILHNGTLYYKTRGIYAVFVESSTETGLAVRPVDPFVPTLLINADPAIPGAGDAYQPLNRLDPFFYVTYSPTEDETTDFYAPFHDCSIVDVEILDSSGAWVSIAHGRFNNVTRKTRGARITASAKEEIQAGQNNVRVLFSRSGFGDYADQYELLMSCHVAAVYGGGEGLCMVLGGCESQPNAYFWSANTDVSMDPTYFPAEHYNLAGDFSDPITAFGQQQNQLVIFQKGRIGAAEFGTTEIDGRTFITMHYRTINPNIGCDLPYSIQLVENNLVFVHTKRGVLLLLDTTSANENNIVHISDNVERDPVKSGLLYDLRQNESAVSMDDGERYWLMTGEHAWLWDYRLGGSVGDPRSLSWFYFDQLRHPVCIFGENGYVGKDGSLCRFSEDGTELFERVLALPVRNFGTYALRKDIAKIVFTLDGSAEGTVDVEYIFDYGSRQEPAPLVCDGGIEGILAFIRRPRCLNVQSFFCRLRSMGQMAFASAQIHYIYRGKER